MPSENNNAEETTNVPPAPAPTPTAPAANPFADLKPLTKPRDLAWDNWAKFPEVGTEVSGYIRDVFFRPEEQVGANTMKAQRGLTLETLDGTLVNVGIKYITFVLAQTDNLRLGDPVKIVFTKTMPPQQKMYSPTKVFSFFGVNLPANASNPTVKELTDLDAKAGGTIAAAPSSIEEDIQIAVKEGEAAGEQAF